jgi:hypothetical protein
MIRTSGIHSEKNHDPEEERSVEDELEGEPLDVATLIQELSKHASTADGSDSDKWLKSSTMIKWTLRQKWWETTQKQSIELRLGHRIVLP